MELANILRKNYTIYSDCGVSASVSSCVSTFVHGANSKNRLVFVARGGVFEVLRCFAGANSKNPLFFVVRANLRCMLGFGSSLSQPGPVVTRDFVNGRDPQAQRSGRDGAKRKVSGGEQPTLGGI